MYTRELHSIKTWFQSRIIIITITIKGTDVYYTCGVDFGLPDHFKLLNIDVCTYIYNILIHVHVYMYKLCI